MRPDRIKRHAWLSSRELRIRRRRRFWAYVAIAAIALGVYAWVSQALAQAQSRPAAGQPLVAAAARQVGIRRCLSAVDAVSRRITQGAIRQDIMMDWDRSRPDVGPLFALTGMSDGVLNGLFTLSAAPTPEGGCSLIAERIGMEKRSCQAFVATTLPDYKSATLIPGILVYYNPSRPGETFTLINSGTTKGASCLVVRRQPVFNTGAGR